MQSTTRVALDAMGGDNAPAEVVKGAVDAVNKRNDIIIQLAKFKNDAGIIGATLI